MLFVPQLNKYTMYNYFTVLWKAGQRIPNLTIKTCTIYNQMPSIFRTYSYSLMAVLIGRIDQFINVEFMLIYIRPIEIKVLSVASIASRVHDLTLTQSSRVQSPVSVKQKVQLMEFARGIRERTSEVMRDISILLYFSFFIHSRLYWNTTNNCTKG